MSRDKQWQNLAMLAEAYHRAGRGAEAVDAARRALAASEGNVAAVEQVNAAIRRYEGGSWAVDK